MTYLPRGLVCPEIEFDEMAWVKPQHSLKLVNASIPAMRAGEEVSLDGAFYFDVLTNWRAAHAYPLSIVRGVLKLKATKVDVSAPVVQRLKRLESIVDKTLRFPTLNLSQMRDIAGCRAIVPSVEDAYRLEILMREAKTRHELKGGKDYIKFPKDDGYRGLHLVYRYIGGDRTSVFDRMLVEVQIRTQMQHAWATTVEMVDAFTGQALKVSRGIEKWRQFFRLMGGFMANLEGTAPVPGLTSDVEDIAREVAQIATELDAVHTIQSCTAVMTQAGRAKGTYFALRLAPNDGMVFVTQFEDLKEADAFYVQEERAYADTRDKVVLVSADSIFALKKAYPNYFPDSTKFIGVLLGILQ